MICKKCGADNPHPIFHPVLLPVQPCAVSEAAVPVKFAIPVRWACEECGRFHFRDGSLYDYERAKKEAAE